MTVAYDPDSPEFHEDPYPTFRRMRAEAPVHHRLAQGRSVWTVTRYEDVTALLRDPRLRTFQFPAYLLDEAARGPEGLGAAARRLAEAPPIRGHPPQHSRVRLALNKAFTPQAVERLRPRVQRLVDRRLDALEGRARFDLIEDLARPLPVLVMGGLLGLEDEGPERLLRWSERLATLADFGERGLRDAAGAGLELRAHLRQVVAARRRAPAEDLISHAIQSLPEGEPVHEDELFEPVAMMLAAGHETTQDLIGNGVLALLRAPEQLERLRAAPALVPSAVEELLRFDPPLQVAIRIAVEDLEVRGRRIRKGDEVHGMLGAANRDPEVFRDPERLDVGREDNKHLAFGMASTYCQAASLARVEGQVAVGTLLRRRPGLRLAEARPQRRPSFLLRGLETLPVVSG